MSRTTGPLTGHVLLCPGAGRDRPSAQRSPVLRPRCAVAAYPVVVRIERAAKPPPSPPLRPVDPAVSGLPCELSDPEMWFAEAPAELERAKVLCADCPVRPACLAGALERREPAGVWGGEIFDNGKIVPRKRARGRPRKDAAAA